MGNDKQLDLDVRHIEKVKGHTDGVSYLTENETYIGVFSDGLIEGDVVGK